MNDKNPISLDDAYAIETPEDSIRLYERWAETYDEDFVEANAYIAFLHIADEMAKRRDEVEGPVLDIGCGTGVVGIALRERGIGPVDGIDISREMLEVSGRKRTTDGDPVYRNLIAADLTQAIDVADSQYGALISAGTFTHGHLGPEPLDELWRVAAPGALCTIGIRTTHYADAGFAGKLAAAVAAGTISEPELIEVVMYAGDGPESGHADHKAFVVVCRVTK